ncbi:hypothetical protein E3N88_22509 [Mikania micrantha]|uniref:2Fe-2S ferredoxin-type domain-containing protein n=1 Tax=Mikania micrantha TaxID=192012 RepID=A0A5N6ND73_9ASTR|nr:hypothetical protein E3N88_22509 [Mikania micrantha]
MKPSPALPLIPASASFAGMTLSSPVPMILPPETRPEIAPQCLGPSRFSEPTACLVPVLPRLLRPVPALPVHLSLIVSKKLNEEHDVQYYHRNRLPDLNELPYVEPSYVYQNNQKSDFDGQPSSHNKAITNSSIHNYNKEEILSIGGDELFSTTATSSVDVENEEKQKICVTFVDKDGEETQIKVPIGMSMLEAAHQNDIELEGACEGSLACSTCHVIVMDVEQYNKLEDPTDEENDMLDLAFGLTETSRLGCQVIAKPELDGLRLALPAATRNFAVDGYKPKPH